MISVAILSYSGCNEGAAGRISVYTSLDEELARVVFNAFTDESSIEVDWLRLSTGECVARLEAEKDDPQVILWFGGVGLGHIEAKNKGLTTPYLSRKSKVPEKFSDPDHYWTGIYAGALCFESNVDKLKQYGLEAPTSWEEIISPHYYNHIQMANPGTSGTSYNIISTVLQLYGEDRGFQYLEDLDNNIPNYTRSGLAPAMNAGLGEVSVAIGYAHDGLRLQKQGYPLVITFPDEGTGYEIASISLVKNGPDHQLDPGQKLYDWALGKEAARIYAQYYVVPFVDVSLSEGALSISEVNTIDQDDIWAAENKQRLVEKWNDLIYNKAE